MCSRHIVVEINNLKVMTQVNKAGEVNCKCKLTEMHTFKREKLCHTKLH